MVYKILTETSESHIILFPDVPPYAASDGARGRYPSDRCILRVCKLINREATLVFPKPIYYVHVVRAAPIDPTYANPLTEWYEGLTETSQKKVNHIRLILPDDDEIDMLRCNDRIKRLQGFNLVETKLNLVAKDLQWYFKHLKVVEVEAWSSNLLQATMNTLALIETVTQVTIVRYGIGR